MVRAGIRKMECPLPPQLVGLDQPAIQKRLGEAGDDYLNELAWATGDLY